MSSTPTRATGVGESEARGAGTPSAGGHEAEPGARGMRRIPPEQVGWLSLSRKDGAFLHKPLPQDPRLARLSARSGIAGRKGGRRRARWREARRRDAVY